MRLKIVSDGTSAGTKIVNADTNEPIAGVEHFTVYGRMGEKFVKAILTLNEVLIDVVVDGDIAKGRMEVVDDSGGTQKKD